MWAFSSADRKEDVLEAIEEILEDQDEFDDKLF